MAFCQKCLRSINDTLSICPYCKTVNPDKVKEFVFSEVFTEKDDTVIDAHEIIYTPESEEMEAPGCRNDVVTDPITVSDSSPAQAPLTDETAKQTQNPEIFYEYKFENLKVILSIVAVLVPFAGFIAGLILSFGNEEKSVKLGKTLLIISGCLICISIFVVGAALIISNLS